MILWSALVSTFVALMFAIAFCKIVAHVWRQGALAKVGLVAFFVVTLLVALLMEIG